MPVLRDVGALLSEWSARRTLRRLIEDFGYPGLIAARRSPSLGAALDQHIAAVRDVLDDRSTGRGSTLLRVDPRARTVRLAAYARGLVDEQRRGGGAVRVPREDEWDHADWSVLRLLAVCHLGRALTGDR